MAERAMATLKVLRVLLDHLDDPEGIHGLALAREAGIASGTLYPILDRLEDEKMVLGTFEEAGARRGGPRRRFYNLTPSGRVAAVAELDVARRALTPTTFRLQPGKV